jgi:hypothetical protein
MRVLIGSGEREAPADVNDTKRKGDLVGDAPGHRGLGAPPDVWVGRFEAEIPRDVLDEIGERPDPLKVAEPRRPPAALDRKTHNVGHRLVPDMAAQYGLGAAFAKYVRGYENAASTRMRVRKTCG